MLVVCARIAATTARMWLIPAHTRLAAEADDCFVHPLSGFALRGRGRGKGAHLILFVLRALKLFGMPCSQVLGLSSTWPERMQPTCLQTTMPRGCAFLCAVRTRALFLSLAHAVCSSLWLGGLQCIVAWVAWPAWRMARIAYGTWWKCEWACSCPCAPSFVPLVHVCTLLVSPAAGYRAPKHGCTLLVSPAPGTELPSIAADVGRHGRMLTLAVMGGCFL